MNLHIRDPRAKELAEKLAERKGVSVAEAVVGALEAELRRETPAIPEAVADGIEPERMRRIQAIIDDLHARRKPGGRDMTKDEIDDMWGMND